MSLEEFAALPAEGARHELDRGELITMAPPQFLHSDIVSNLFYALGRHVRTLKLGYVHAEAGFVLSSDPATVRQPDVSFLSASAAVRKPTKGYFPGAPTIAFEVVSPSESATDLETKIRQYLTAGSKAVVSIYPDSRSVWVHRPDGASRRLEGDAALTFPDILDEWSLPLGDTFPASAE